MFNNEDLNEVTWEQRVIEGNPKFAASQPIPNFAYARFGEMLGFRGIFVNKPDDLHGAWQEALSSDRPVVLKVKTDPDVAPLPPHLTLKQARAFMSSIVEGDPSAGHMIADTARQVLGGILNRKSLSRGPKPSSADLFRRARRRFAATINGSLRGSQEGLS